VTAGGVGAGGVEVGADAGLVVGADAGLLIGEIGDVGEGAAVAGVVDWTAGGDETVGEGADG